ncbi:hypothetical protein TNCV_330391 [Trichonephila clavipes]|nr:hypothetical protein TNCV_330391 [Trichonephila clavipes]
MPYWLEKVKTNKNSCTNFRKRNEIRTNERLWCVKPSGQGNGLVASVSSVRALYRGRPTVQRDRCTLNLSGFERSPIGVMWELGRRVSAQVWSSSFDHGSKLRGPSPKSLD